MSHEKRHSITIIPDGYTRPGRIAAVNELHGELNFTFRPMVPNERDDIYAVIRRFADDPRKYNEVISKAIADKVQEWDARDTNGKTYPITPRNAANLQPELFDKLYNVLMGTRASDPVEDQTEEEHGGYVASLMGTRTNKPPGDVQTEADAGNLSKG